MTRSLFTRASGLAFLALPLTGWAEEALRDQLYSETLQTLMTTTTDVTEVADFAQGCALTKETCEGFRTQFAPFVGERIAAPHAVRGFVVIALNELVPPGGTLGDVRCAASHAGGTLLTPVVHGLGVEAAFRSINAPTPEASCFLDMRPIGAGDAEDTKD